MKQQGIIIATFGSIYSEAVEKSIGVIERKVTQLYPQCVVRRVFLAGALVDKWNDKYDVPVQGLEEALVEMNELGVVDVFIQPITLVADQCYLQMRKQVNKMLYSNIFGFQQVNVGKPLLTSLGVKNYSDDYEATLKRILRHIGSKGLNKAILLMANGQNQLEYSVLQLKAMHGIAPHVTVFTTNGFPTFKQALQWMSTMEYKDVLVVPLALIGSEHLMDYLGGDRSDSIYALLVEEGYAVTIWNEGLGENPFIQELFIKHLGRAMRLCERKKGVHSADNKMATSSAAINL